MEFRILSRCLCFCVDSVGMKYWICDPDNLVESSTEFIWVRKIELTKCLPAFLTWPLQAFVASSSSMKLEIICCWHTLIAVFYLWHCVTIQGLKFPLDAIPANKQANLWAVIQCSSFAPQSLRSSSAKSRLFPGGSQILELFLHPPSQCTIRRSPRLAFTHFLPEQITPFFSCSVDSDGSSLVMLCVWKQLNNLIVLFQTLIGKNWPMEYYLLPRMPSLLMDACLSVAVWKLKYIQHGPESRVKSRTWAGGTCCNWALFSVSIIAEGDENVLFYWHRVGRLSWEVDE